MDHHRKHQPAASHTSLPMTLGSKGAFETARVLILSKTQIPEQMEVDR